MHDDLLNTGALAAEKHLSVSYLNKLRLTGDGPPFLKIGKKVLYRRSDVERWFASRVRTSTSDQGKGRAA
ncbi:helix-turn-helix transcriptional regulator [Labrys sp. (in: a-proteobacteria)]|uniref:helix-turn-helix transcriptional regulator n=1 Tax=Labrys sp. (in: a-proteobacteria) TaxID=1917972 RepID=UPI0039E61B35